MNAYQVEGYYRRALTYCDINDYEKAMEDCKTALNIKPDFVPAKHLRSIIEGKIFSSEE